MLFDLCPSPQGEESRDKPIRSPCLPHLLGHAPGSQAQMDLRRPLPCVDPPEKGWCQCCPELKLWSKGSICGVWMELGHAGWADHTHVPTRLLIVWDGVGADEKATGQRQAIEQRYESALPKSSIPAQSPKVSKNSALKHRLPGCPGSQGRRREEMLTNSVVQE